MGKQSASVNRKKINPYANHRRRTRQKKAAVGFKAPFAKKISKMKMKLHRLAMEKDIEKALKAQGIDIDNLMIEESESKKSKKIPNSKPKNQKEKPAIKKTPSTTTKATEVISGRRSRREKSMQNSSNEAMDEDRQNRGRRTTRSASRKKKMKAKARARGKSKASAASAEGKMEID